MRREFGKLFTQMKKTIIQAAKDVVMSIVKSAVVVAINHYAVQPIMKKLKKIYDRNPQM